MKKMGILIGVVLFIVLAIFFLEQHGNLPQRSGNVSASLAVPQTSDLSTALSKAARYPSARELVGIAGYINVPDIKLHDFIGKNVILIDFWTYSCINCQRTLPYITTWHEKYKDYGLLIVGVHTPEFEFEKEYDNVAAAAKKFGVRYPIVLDNNYGTWRAYQNSYWPRKYLIDIDGYVVYDHIGEGGYDETEAKIQELLAERNVRFEIKTNISQNMATIDSAEISSAQSPEIYFGSTRNSYLGNGKSGVSGVQSFPSPSHVARNTLYFNGSWDVHEEFAANSGLGSIIFRYYAKSVFFVARSDEGISITILNDGKSVVENAGADIIVRDGKSTVTVREPRLYRLIENEQAGEHTLEIVVPQSGLQAFTFTFG